MLEEQKQTANDAIGKLYDYLQSLFDTDINGVNDLIQNQHIQITGGFARRLYYLQNNVELKPKDYEAFCNESDIDIFLVNCKSNIHESNYFGNHEEKPKESSYDVKGSFDLTDISCSEQVYNLNSTKNDFVLNKSNIDYMPTYYIKGKNLPHSIIGINKKVRNDKKASFKNKWFGRTSDETLERTYLYKKKNPSDYEGDNDNLSPLKRYYDPLVSFEIINNKYTIINRKHLFKTHNGPSFCDPQKKNPFGPFNVINSYDDNINVQLIKTLGVEELKFKIKDTIDSLNTINSSICNKYDNKEIIDNYCFGLSKNNLGVFTEVFDLECSRYTITQLGQDLSTTHIQSDDNGKFYEIEINDNLPIFNNIDRRVVKYLEYGFELPEHTQTKLIRRKRESEIYNISVITFGGYY